MRIHTATRFVRRYSSVYGVQRTYGITVNTACVCYALCCLYTHALCMLFFLYIFFIQLVVFSFSESYGKVFELVVSYRAVVTTFGHVPTTLNIMSASNSVNLSTG